MLNLDTSCSPGGCWFSVYPAEARGKILGCKAVVLEVSQCCETKRGIPDAQRRRCGKPFQLGSLAFLSSCNKLLRMKWPKPHTLFCSIPLLEVCQGSQWTQSKVRARLCVFWVPREECVSLTFSGNRSWCLWPSSSTFKANNHRSSSLTVRYFALLCCLFLPHWRTLVNTWGPTRKARINFLS